MFVQDVKKFAERAFSHLNIGERIAVQQQRSPGPSPSHSASRPEVKVEDDGEVVSVRCRVPGATRHNTLVCWDEYVHTLSIRVELSAAAGRIEDAYVEVVLPITADGSRSKCVIKDGLVRVRTPHQNTIGLTGLPLFASFEGEPLPASC